LIEYPKPTVVISSCIEFEHVRYDGQIIRSPFVKQLLPFIEPITVCPEIGIGLGVPRETLRLVKVKDVTRLAQPSTGKDFKEDMTRFSEEFLGSLEVVDGFILKSRSPSSAFRDAKIYAGERNAPRIGKGPGVFGEAVLDRFSHLALEDEGRLRNGRIREHFLRKLYTLTRFREAKETLKLGELISFHTENKLLLKAYNQKELRMLGRIVANHEKLSIEEVYDNYAEHLYLALRRGPRCPSIINVLTNSMGYLSELAMEEKNMFLDYLEKYRKGKLPLVSPMSIMVSWITRFHEEYLGNQTFFNPYPEELMTIEAVLEACDAKDYWI